eukprot:jgi/Botrbrau1/1713/Bobra.116_2s0055.1
MQQTTPRHTKDAHARESQKKSKTCLLGRLQIPQLHLKRCQKLPGPRTKRTTKKNGIDFRLQAIMCVGQEPAGPSRKGKLRGHLLLQASEQRQQKTCSRGLGPERPPAASRGLGPKSAPQSSLRN